MTVGDIDQSKSCLRVSIDGRIFNRERLRALALDWGEAPAPESDADLVALLYDRYGVELVHAVDGEFALAVADDRDGTMFAARDRFGCVPSPDLPPAGRRLRRGGEDGPVERYWRLPERTDPGGESDAELVAELHRLLGAAVGARVGGHASVGILDDGGPASALLSALARRWSIAVEPIGSNSLDDLGGRLTVLGTAGATQLYGGAAGDPEPGPVVCRSPYLDRDVAEFATTVPPRLLGTGGGSLLALARKAIESD